MVKNKSKDGCFYMKSSIACVTGYRPQKCPWGFNEKDPRCINMKNRALIKFRNAIERNYHTFEVGMALGFDMISAEILLELKRDYDFIRIEGILPCENQDKFWSPEQKERYKNILKQLDSIHYVHKKYTGPKCMLDRNSYMLSRASLVIALYDGKPGGTEKTLKEAEKLGLEIDIIEP